ncbi:MAG: hypothetical protein LBR66_07235 [Candidatus Symbiothrix sp.]|jgi:hypothetical protein|nr:hypothetical protein [Candidatus Symbiothrix sp.]
MKKVVLFSVMTVALIACNGKKQAAPVEETPVAVSIEVPVYDLDSLLQIAEQEVDKTVKVVGYVTHTCKHSGKRCFIVGESQTASMRVEAKGEIGGFNRELIGSKLAIIGEFKERRLSQEYINQMEKDVNLQKEENGAAESCQAELNNINDMRKWMKDHGKDYYSIYYMDGQSFEILE